MRIYRALILDPAAYLDIAPIPGVSGRGREKATVEALERSWTLRFLDGFPIGPNFSEDAEGRIRMTRFSRDRMHLDCDAAAFGDEEPGRVFVDYRFGIGCDRNFREGKLLHVETKLDLWTRHGISEFYDVKDPGRITELSLDKETVARDSRDGAGLVLSRRRADIDGRTIERRFFASGALNVEAEVLEGGLLERILRCHDENGAELAPGGTGVLRERAGDGWRTGRIVDGFLEGEVVRTDGSGMVIATERYAHGYWVQEQGEHER